MPPQPKPELPNPVAAPDHFTAAPREFHAARARAAAGRRDGAKVDQRNSGAAYGAGACGDRTRSAARSPARTGDAAERARGFAIGADRRFRKRDQRNSGEPPASRSVRRASLPLRAALPRPPQLRLPTTRPPAAAQASRRRQGQERQQGTVDHHLKNPFAAGRRERGRDRARHLQDGDDAARLRQRAADAGDGRIEPAAAVAASARR